MKIIVSALVFAFILTTAVYAAPIIAVPNPTTQKAVPYNGSYNGNYSYPTPSYYENGIPVYVDSDNGGKSYSNTPYNTRKSTYNDDFPHYKGVTN